MALKRPAVTQNAETNTSAQEAPVDQVKETVNEQVLETREDQANAALAQAREEQADQGGEAAKDSQPEPEAQPEKDVNAEQVEVKETKAEPVQAEAKEVAIKQTGEVAVASAAHDAVRGAMAQYTQEMAELGFEGLTVDGMSFDRVKLSEGKFVMGTEEISLGESFDVQLMTTRPIFVVRKEDRDDSPLFFSYDPQGLTLTDGTSSQAIRDEWLEDGFGGPDAPLDIKRYLEGMAQLINRDDEWDGHMVSLSIPPASTSRLGGATMTGKQRWGRDPSGLCIRCKVGQKVQKGNISWRPWVFIAVGPYDAA